MQPIIPTLQKNKQGPDVKNLHYVLFFLTQKLDNPSLNNFFNEAGFLKAYKAEVFKQLYGNATGKFVNFLQDFLQVQQFEMSVVDNPTAKKLNEMLREFNGLEMDKPEGYPFEVSDVIGDNTNNEVEGKYKVSGFVFDTNNKIVDHQPVLAFDIDLLGSGIYKKAVTITELTAKGGVQALGKPGITDGNGFYNIEFIDADFKTDESETDPTADVLVLAVDGDTILGKSQLSKRKDYLENELQNWNVTFSNEISKRGSSEFQVVSTVILRFLTLQISNIEAWQMQSNADMIEFLSGEISIAQEKVTAYINADFLLHDAMSGVNEAPKFAADAQKARELLYGLVKPTAISNWAAISKTSIADITNFIVRSSAANIIGTFSEQDISSFAEALHNYATKKSLILNNRLKSILSVALKTEALSEKFHTLYINHTGTPKEFWDSLAQDNDLKDNVQALKLTNQLAALTGNNALVINAFAPLVKNNDIVSLLELSVEDWNTAIGNNIPTFISNGNVDDYRNFMLSQLHAAFYSEKVSLMVKNENEIKIADQSIREKLNTFVTTTKFDLRYSRLHDKVAGSDDTFQKRLDDIGGDQKEELKNQLNKVQRVFQFSPSPEIMTKLLDAGIDSATLVASIPFSTFKLKYKDVGDEQTLLAIHQRACHIVSMLEYSILSLNRLSQSAKIPAIAGK